MIEAAPSASHPITFASNDLEDIIGGTNNCVYGNSLMIKLSHFTGTSTRTLAETSVVPRTLQPFTRCLGSKSKITESLRAVKVSGAER